MSDESLGAPTEGSPENVFAEDIGASEATENTTGQPADGEAPAEVDAEAKAKAEAEEKERERKSRNERRREQKARLIEEARQAEAQRRATEEQLARAQAAARALAPPRAQDFPSVEAYQAELVKYATAAALSQGQVQTMVEAARAHQAQEEAARRQAQQVDAQNWATQEQEARARYADFERVVYAPDLQISEPMAQALAQSDMAADLAYWLGKNPQESARLARMHPYDMARAIGRIEAQLAAPPPPLVTTAPAPITPVRAKAAPVKSPETMSFAEYAAARKSGRLR